MCILYFCQSEIWQPDGYRLILANNRDEYWDRPTKEADFWAADKSCISGLDQMPGREGGTWLGMNSSGKLAVLLNILGQQDPNKLGRGHLVTKFISGSEDIDQYGTAIHKQRYSYNGFNLVLFDLGKQEDSLTVKPLYISNAMNYCSCVTKRNLPANTFFGVSNSPLEYPFQKVEQGRARFGRIVCQYPNVSSRQHLIDNLMGLMQDQTNLLPDPVLEVVAASVGFSPLRTGQHSAVNVYSPAQRYGSRTSSLILVDGEGQVDYVERNTFFGSDDLPESVDTVHKVFSLGAQT
ncbi:transport and Golgi organization protein 2 homolog [Aplysia californica]|uniref:Transport and Golgi organization protein 2 homolog n=1 Tax=Aplysia californica TaxID=6500 RepID=A0ABM0JL17_APLCA|nr:transport and Golgi organization protein 2 homolog [Aplysia californica]